MIGKEQLRIGHFRDVRREQAGANLAGRIVTTGSLVLRQVGGDRAGELSANRFLGSYHVTAEEIVQTAGQPTAVACAGRRAARPAR